MIVYPFKQDDCPKCGYGQDSIGDEPNGRKYHFRPLNACPEFEHLHYTCRRCGFIWTTECKDAESAVSSS